MAKKMNGRKLTDKEIDEIHKLRTEGCPCCKCPIPCPVLAEKYGASTSTISRIGSGIIVSSGTN